MNPFVKYDNYFDQKYFAPLGNRWPTFKAALNLYVQRGLCNIMETGCWRFDGDVGGGESTKMFCEFIRYVTQQGLGYGCINTVDKSHKHVHECRLMTESYSDICTVHHGDSVTFLKEWGAPIDLLYLDSFDYPYMDLVKQYGEWSVPLLDQVKAIGEAEIVKRHWGIIGPCQEHCLQEIEAAMPNLHKKSVVLIDDNDIPGGGKPRLAKQFLASQGWTCLLDWQQTLWIKE